MINGNGVVRVEKLVVRVALTGPEQCFNHQLEGCQAKHKIRVRAGCRP